MRLDRHADRDALTRAAGAFLAAREAEHNLILGILSAPAAPDEERPYLASVSDERGAVIAVAVMTPPWNLVLSEVDDPAALGPIVDDARADLAARGSGAHVRGVIGPAPEAAALAELWRQRSGQAIRLAARERIFRLQRVVAPRPAPGTMRVALPADRPLLVAWLRAFNEEAMGGEEPVDAEVIAERMLSGGRRVAYLWQDGDVVSLAAVGSPTPHGARVGPVYTPPEHRGRGYASNLVAALSQAELAAGRHYLFLFTDRANPTPNHVYQAIGYEPVRDVDDWRFEPVSSPPRAPVPPAS